MQLPYTVNIYEQFEDCNCQTSLHQESGQKPGKPCRCWPGQECLDYIIQRRESKYDLRQQHCVSVQRFETYYKKNSLSHRVSTVWNLLEPSALRTRDYAKRAKKAHALSNSNFKEESPQRAVPKLTEISYFINSIHTHIFHCTYFTFY